MIKTFDGKTPRIAPTAFVSEAAYVVGDVEIGESSSIWPGAVIRGDFTSIKIGNNPQICHEGVFLAAATKMLVPAAGVEFQLAWTFPIYL